MAEPQVGRGGCRRGCALEAGDRSLRIDPSVRAAVLTIHGLDLSTYRLARPSAARPIKRAGGSRRTLQRWGRRNRRFVCAILAHTLEALGEASVAVPLGGANEQRKSNGLECRVCQPGRRRLARSGRIVGLDLDWRNS